MAGTIIADKWQNGDGTENFKCRAWVNFNGTGTVAIRASGNVSSITDNGTGNYTVNFTTVISDANYAHIVYTGDMLSGSSATPFISRTTSSFQFATTVDNSTRDEEDICVAIFR